MAAAAIRGLAGRLVRGADARGARLSLPRTAKLLIDQSAAGTEPPFAAENRSRPVAGGRGDRMGTGAAGSSAGRNRRRTMAWAHPAGDLGTTEPRWT
jgi:hypothetical protein